MSSGGSREGPPWEDANAGANGEGIGESVGVCTDDPSVSVLTLVALTVARSSSSSASLDAVEHVWRTARTDDPSAWPIPRAFASDIISRIRSSVFRNTLRPIQAG